MSRASMVKPTIGVCGVFLGASGSGVSEPIAVGTLGVAVSLPCFLDLESFREEEYCWEENRNVVGVNGEDDWSGLLCKPNSSALVKVPGRANLDRVPFEDGVCEALE